MSDVSFSGFGRIESAFRTKRAAGRKLLVPFITAGMTDNWVDYVHAIAAAGADAIEIGVPFSDPMMDGPVIQSASTIALHRGTTPSSVLSDIRAFDGSVPLVAMTAYNLAFRAGDERFASMLAEAGFSGTILPDLQLDEASSWMRVAASHSIENVLLVAPTTPDGRLKRICDASRGFVYGVGTMGVTGERASLAASASTIATRLKAATDRPVLVGIGVSNADQAVEISHACDGAIVGAALVRRLLEGASPSEIGSFVGELRAGLDSI